MVPLKLVVMTVVEDHAEPAHSDKNAVEEHAFAHPTVLEDNAVMMVVEEHHVDLALLLKLAPTDSVLEQLLPTVLEDNVETTEPEETAVTAQLVKDAEVESVNVIMIVMTETAVPLLKQRELTSDCVPKDLVDHAHQDLLVALTEDVQLKHPVMFLLQLLTVLHEELLLSAVQFSLAQLPSVTVLQSLSQLVLPLPGQHPESDHSPSKPLPKDTWSILKNSPLLQLLQMLSFVLIQQLFKSMSEMHSPMSQLKSEQPFPTQELSVEALDGMVYLHLLTEVLDLTVSLLFPIPDTKMEI